VSDPAVKVVCFDIGGVLINHCRSWAEGCEHAGLPVREGGWVTSEEAIARRRAAIWPYQRGECSTEEYHAMMAEALNGRYSREEVARVHRAWILDEYPGVAPLVRELGAISGLTTACLSNTNEAHWEQMLGSDGRVRYPSCTELQVRLASHRLGASKPEPDAFALAQERLGARPEQILFFEDGPQNVEAARRADARAPRPPPRRRIALEADRGPARARVTLWSSTATSCLGACCELPNVMARDQAGMPSGGSEPQTSSARSDNP